MVEAENQKYGKILLIEDELPIAKALTLKLSRAGFSVEHLEDGKEAPAQVKKDRYDLIILDLVMPNTDGFEVLKEIKEFTKDTPIVVWSNLSQPEDVARAKELGAREYWVKLTTPLAMVLERVSGLIRGSPHVIGFPDVSNPMKTYRKNINNNFITSMDETKKHILIIEDEYPLAHALSLKFENAGFMVTTASGGEQAIADMKENTYDLIILDLVMPNTDGFEVLKEIKEFTKDTPIVVWSNLSQPEDVARAKELGAREYWVKLDVPLASVVERSAALIG